MFQLKQWLAILGTTATLSAAGGAHAGVILSEGFEPSGAPAGWLAQSNTPGLNRSTPVGPESWGKGNTNFFNAQSGTVGSYFADTFEAASQAGTSAVISDWLLTPTILLNNGYTFSFWARSDGDPSFPDSLQLRLSTSGTSANVGTTATSVGVFTTLLLSINPTVASGGFPTNWTQYTGTISGLTGLTSGRLAFRYFLPDGINTGDYIGIDNVVVTAVPEPETVAVLALGLGAMGLGLRRKSRPTKATLSFA